ncbi:hypothetical protein PoB_001980800 [Plakobranchus ocellatus]|uniref:Uncharacterized protein n=1 Tax=Plakobranchus ocellatus TaxID=259542 RepID=A0AAV3ZEW6_9GAST|nr:hypothetical protein PoB_001980800 [Plakobranchus ocellatus]
MHPFYVIKNALRNWIKGCDFLKQQNARIYFDLEKLRLNDEYINLDQDIPPQTSVRVSGKLETWAYYEPRFTCQVNQDARSCIRDEPGLLLANSLSKLDNRCRCQLFLVNSTTKTYTLRRGSIMGKMSVVENEDIHTLAEVVKSTPQTLSLSPDFSEVQVPEDYRQEVTTILKKNADVFAASDTDFGLTNNVTMTIDTDDDVFQALRKHFHMTGKGRRPDPPKNLVVTRGLLLQLKILKEESQESFKPLKVWLDKLAPELANVTEGRIKHSVTSIVESCKQMSQDVCSKTKQFFQKGNH